ncbi:MAG: MarR family transcriptional regulator [Pseudomonadota bacterium]
MTTNKDEKDLTERLISQWASESPDLDVAAMAIVGRVMRLGRRFEYDAAAVLKPLGLVYTDFDILATLRRSGPPYELTPGELGEAVLLSSGAMTAALDRLSNAALIERPVNDYDRRIKSARLTAAGKRLSKRAAKARFAVAASAVDGLSRHERATLATLLKALGQ